MRIVLDTNCFLAVLPKKSKYRPIFDSYLKGNLEISFSTEILNEYSEIFTEKTNIEISNNIIELILKNQNSVFAEIYFKWGLIKEDFDDNKFVDTAISSNADFIVTEDKHFNILKTIDFPKVEIHNLDSFLNFLNSN